MTEASSAVCTGDNGYKWVSLLEVTEVVALSDLLPSKPVSLPETEFFELRMDVDFMRL
tara:strand:+ start:12392 stop:12565 length:174 start_codon:yes stop_codon:yes gene_type:complete